MFSKLLDTVRKNDPEYNSRDKLLHLEREGKNTQWILRNIREVYMKDPNCVVARDELAEYMTNIADNCYLRLGAIIAIVKFLLTYSIPPFHNDIQYEEFKNNMRPVTDITDTWEEDWMSIINVCAIKVYIGNSQQLISVCALTS